MPSQDEVTETLKKVTDPELGINIIDLGLVYEIKVGKDQVSINMTMTTPACPMHVNIIDSVKGEILKSHSDISKVDVDLVWEPAWKPEMMSPAAKEFLQ
ncbi:MAG: metal-sulfur cluster assembly factor [Proteobacteria bacterium]|nr:metal-sulfur cluster assembly factor [Pseudomonadota bacterium]